MSQSERQVLASSGGIYMAILQHAFSKLDKECVAFHGYSADARAIAVAIDSGFELTPSERLFARWNKALPARDKEAVHAMVNALGPF